MRHCLLALLCGTVLSASAAHFPRPHQDNNIVGNIQLISVPKGSTVLGLAKHYDISSNKLLAANPRLQTHTLRAGESLTLPTRFILPHIHQGIVINLATTRLFYFKGNTVYTYPIAVGRDGWETPTGLTNVIKKVKNPTWHVPASIRTYKQEKTGKPFPRMVPPGPNNPLGPYALFLRMRGILIHGNNNPTSIGHYVSSGCIRLYNHDISELFPLVPLRLTVDIIHQPVVVGWQQGKLFIEAHTPTQHDLSQYKFTEQQVIHTILQSGIAKSQVNWQRVAQAIKNNTGIPTRISR